MKQTLLSMRASPSLLGLTLLAAACVLPAFAAGCSDDPAPPQPQPDGGTTDATMDPDGSVDAAPPEAEAGEPVYVKTSTETFDYGGAVRKYLLSVPVDYDATKKYPVYMFMHGSPGTAEGMLATYPVDKITKGEAIVVYPNALGSDWNLYAPTASNTDMGYLQALVDEVAKKVSIDKGRVLGSGWSGGAFMSSQTACRVKLFKAIAIHAGGAPYELPENSPQKDAQGFFVCPGGPVATLVTHGRADTTVTPDSGEFAATHWAHVNGCGTTTAPTAPSPCVAYAGCPAGLGVTLCMIDGLGHPLWVEAQKTAWAFFKALP